MSLHLELVTPERILFSIEAERVTLPTAEGEITVLANHAPLVAKLVAGMMILVTKQGTEEVAVSGGFIEILKDNRVRVLADTAERGEELDLTAITAAKERAEQVMKETVRSDDTAYALAAASLERELAREKVARRAHAARRVPTVDAASLPHDENPV
ncbi:MAG: ATP synthase F1 subunit epsilon [Patescibacteria group bacterium]|jgi:F-type H+-transporting ATPase subunit epsilon